MVTSQARLSEIGDNASPIYESGLKGDVVQPSSDIMFSDVKLGPSVSTSFFSEHPQI